MLLKNKDKILPLEAGLSIGIIGPHANASGILASNYRGQLCPQYGDLSCIQGLTQALEEFQNVCINPRCVRARKGRLAGKAAFFNQTVETGYFSHRLWCFLWVDGAGGRGH